MKNKILKCILLFTIITLIGVSVLNFTSCDRKYDEQEVLTAADELLRRSEELNVVLWGKGLNYSVTQNMTGAYYEADYLDAQKYGFSTLEDMYTAIDATFTVGYAASIYSTVFSPINDGSSTFSLARYYQLWGDTMTKTDPVCIMVYSEYDYLFHDTVEYDYSTLRVSDVEKKTVFVTVSATVTNAEGDSQSVDIEFGMIEEENGWRIDSPTYVNYNSYRDQYEDLLDKLEK